MTPMQIANDALQLGVLVNAAGALATITALVLGVLYYRRKAKGGD